MRYALVALLVGLTGSAADNATLSVSQYTNANRVRAFVFQGTISGRQGGEYVEILGRDCGAEGDRLISGTQTAGGGGFRVENPLTEPPYSYTAVNSGTTFRARWNGAYSEPRLWQLPARPQVARISGTRTWVVHVTPATPTGQVGFQGKTVELQRLTPSGWARVRTGRLVKKASLRWARSTTRLGSSCRPRASGSGPTCPSRAQGRATCPAARSRGALRGSAAGARALAAGRPPA